LPHSELSISFAKVRRPGFFAMESSRGRPMPPFCRATSSHHAAFSSGLAPARLAGQPSASIFRRRK